MSKSNFAEMGNEIRNLKTLKLVDRTVAKLIKKTRFKAKTKNEKLE